MSRLIFNNINVCNCGLKFVENYSLYCLGPKEQNNNAFVYFINKIDEAFFVYAKTNLSISNLNYFTFLSSYTFLCKHTLLIIRPVQVPFYNIKNYTTLMCLKLYIFRE